MKKLFWMVMLIIVLIAGLIDRTQPGQPARKMGRGYTVKTIFAGLDSREDARALAENVMDAFALRDPVLTIARDGEL